MKETGVYKEDTAKKNPQNWNVRKRSAGNKDAGERK
jgi:hypothetical protein